jgi:DNA-binding MarR family transcriptional regulator
VRLTPKGREHFAVMAAEHEHWLRERFDGMPLRDQQQLYDLLGAMRAHLSHLARPGAGND